MHQNAEQRLREARSCYDHLAGRLGVEITEALVRKQLLQRRGEQFRLTARGRVFFADLGIDALRLQEQRRQFACACLDWTERRRHLAGALGASLLDLCLRNGWLLRNAHDRALAISAGGRARFARVFDLPA